MFYFDSKKPIEETEVGYRYDKDFSGMFYEQTRTINLLVKEMRSNGKLPEEWNDWLAEEQELRDSLSESEIDSYDYRAEREEEQMIRESESYYDNLERR